MLDGALSTVADIVQRNGFPLDGKKGDSSLISTSVRMVHPQRTSDEKAAGTRPPEDQSQGVRHDRTENTGNRSQLPVTPWFASRRRWRSARSLDRRVSFGTPRPDQVVNPHMGATGHD